MQSIGVPFRERRPKAAYGHLLPQGEKGRREEEFSIAPEHELAVAFKERSGPHIELPVLSDEKQRALRHLFRALQQQLGIVGAHLVGKRLAFLVVAIAHVRCEHPGRRRRGLRKCGCPQRDQRGCDQQCPGGKSRHHASSRNRSSKLVGLPTLEQTTNAIRPSISPAHSSQRVALDFRLYDFRLCDSPHSTSRLSFGFSLELFLKKNT